jgi:hypothetical protein
MFKREKRSKINAKLEEEGIRKHLWFRGLLQSVEAGDEAAIQELEKFRKNYQKTFENSMKNANGSYKSLKEAANKQGKNMLKEHANIVSAIRDFETGINVFRNNNNTNGWGGNGIGLGVENNGAANGKKVNNALIVAAEGEATRQRPFNPARNASMGRNATFTKFFSEPVNMPLPPISEEVEAEVAVAAAAAAPVAPAKKKTAKKITGKNFPPVLGKKRNRNTIKINNKPANNNLQVINQSKLTDPSKAMIETITTAANKGIRELGGIYPFFTALVVSKKGTDEAKEIQKSLHNLKLLPLLNPTVKIMLSKMADYIK